MRAIAIVCVLLTACATPPAKQERIVTKSLFDGWVAGCVRSGYVEYSAEHQACVMRLAKQYIDLVAPPPRPGDFPASRTTTCRPDGFGAIICTDS